MLQMSPKRMYSNVLFVAFLIDYLHEFLEVCFKK
jgi:hypothetical protein